MSSITLSISKVPPFSLADAKSVSSTNINPMLEEQDLDIGIVILTPQFLFRSTSTAGALVTAQEMGLAPFPCNIPWKG